MQAIGLLGWVEIFKAVLNAPGDILRLVRAFQSVPEEQRQENLKAIEAEAANLKAGGRPKWD
jgi:hypothetical protein